MVRGNAQWTAVCSLKQKKVGHKYVSDACNIASFEERIGLPSRRKTRSRMASLALLVVVVKYRGREKGNGAKKARSNQVIIFHGTWRQSSVPQHLVSIRSDSRPT